jgi:hypothetical protein
MRALSAVALLSACSAAFADFRVQLVRDAPLLARADASAQSAGSSRAGDILFAKALTGGFYAVSAPEGACVWLSRDLVENNKIAARSALVRTGPGIACERVGELPRGTRVMALAEDGDWCQIAAPSTLTVYVDASAAVQLSPGGDGGFADVTAPTGLPAAPAAPAPPAPPAPTGTISPTVPGAPIPSADTPKPGPPPPPAAVPESQAKPAPAPVAPAPAAAPAPAPAPAAPAAAPVSTYGHVRRPMAQQPLRRPDGSPMPSAPAARPQQPVRPAVTPAAPPTIVHSPVSGNPPMVSASRPGIAPVAPSTSAARPAPLPPLRRELLADLSLSGDGDQGRAVRIRGQLRTDPLRGYAPYRLLRRSEKSVDVVCSVKGDSAELRGLVGRNVVIRGYRYHVTQSSLPVIVVGDIVEEKLP